MSTISAIPEEVAPNLRANALSLTEATVTGLSNMAPAMSLFFAVAFIAGSVGASIPFIFIVAMIGILFTANSLAQFARMFPSAGSFITYISKAFGPAIGTVLATFLIVGYAVAAGAVYSVLGGWVSDVLSRDLSLHINWIVLMIVLLVILGTLLVIGVQVSTRAALVLFLFETAVLLVLGIIILANKGGSLSATPFAPPASSTGGLAGIATGFALAIYSFVGWEASAPLAEETDSPKRNVPIALITAVIVLAAIYVFVTYAVTIAYGVTHTKTLAGDLTPFSTLARVYFGPLRGIVDIAGITSISASMLALTNTQGRILFHGGRAGIFPSALGRISSRFKTPYVAIITYMAMVTAAVLVTMAWLGGAKLANDPFTIYGVLGTFGTLPLIIIYGLTNVALIVYTARNRPSQMNPITHYLLPAIGVIVMLAPAWDFFQTSAPPFDRVAEITLLLFIFGVVYGLIIARTRPEAAQRVGTAIEGYERVEGAPV